MQYMLVIVCYTFSDILIFPVEVSLLSYFSAKTKTVSRTNSECNMADDVLLGEFYELK